jgi:hypothetical protein
VWLIAISIGCDLIENRDDKDCSFSHSRLSLAKDVLSLECEWDGFDLYFTGMFEAALSDGSFELIFEEEFVPSCEVGTLILFVDIFFGFFVFIGAVVVGDDISHVYDLK